MSSVYLIYTFVYLSSIAKASIEKSNLIQNKDDYCDINKDHTLCQFQLGNYAERCGKVIKGNLTEDEKLLVMDLHNKKRMLIANGLEKRGDPGPQPPAANMMELTWDEELALMAQVWTEQCVLNCMVNSCHDCPTCRKSKRFHTGQNYYNFGHFSGSWERSVDGWYDEVVDFNKSFVYPFYTIPGVLVGHYTQLVWGPTSRIGCGKIVHKPKNGPNKWGSQIFVCDYGIGGNFLRSEMYKIGPACSACPNGTSCSSKYPGLCSGNPDKPITQRPPLHSWEVDGTYPTRKPIFGKNITNIRPIEPEIITEEFVKPPQIHDGDDKCIYTCRKDKGCSVKISSNHPISGPIVGSCFPPSFGGSCSGIPDDCSECLSVCKGEDGHEIIVDVSKDGKNGKQIKKPLSGDKKDEENDSNDKKDECLYNCQESGGCSVRIISKSFVSGATMGSCFSERFGGKCTGIPERCEKCLSVCKEKPGKQFSLPAKDE